jgi:hypothetical protein
MDKSTMSHGIRASGPAKSHAKSGVSRLGTNANKRTPRSEKLQELQYDRDGSTNVVARVQYDQARQDCRSEVHSGSERFRELGHDGGDTSGGRSVFNHVLSSSSGPSFGSNEKPFSFSLRSQPLGFDTGSLSFSLRHQSLGTRENCDPLLASSPSVLAGLLDGIDVSDVIQRRRKNYRMQGHARYLMRNERRLSRKVDEDGKCIPMPYRVCNCRWAQRDSGNGVTAVLTSEGAKYADLQICGSIWHCPVCASRITNVKRREIQEVIDAAALQGYKAVLVTFTARHDAKTHLGEQLGAMSKAYEAIWRGEPAQRLKVRYGILGRIRTLEVTHSKHNGWHPHMHGIIFIRRDADTQSFANELGARWERLAVRHGLSMNQHGFDATDAEGRIADYVAKWGHEPQKDAWTEADELARWHTKKGRSYNDHLTPWQLLEASQEGDIEAGCLFVEYAKVYHGRRQVEYSANLRRGLGLLDEKSDEKAAEEDLEGKKLLDVVLTLEQWYTVRGNDARALLLEILEQSHGDAQVICDAVIEAFDFEPHVLLWGDDVGQPQDVGCLIDAYSQ